MPRAGRAPIWQQECTNLTAISLSVLHQLNLKFSSLLINIVDVNHLSEACCRALPCPAPQPLSDFGFFCSVEPWSTSQTSCTCDALLTKQPFSVNGASESNGGLIMVDM